MIGMPRPTSDREAIEAEIDRVRSLGLDVVTRSYVLIDVDTFRCERLDT